MSRSDLLNLSFEIKVSPATCNRQNAYLNHLTKESVMKQRLSLRTDLRLAFAVVISTLAALAPANGQQAPAAQQPTLSADASAAIARMGKALQAGAFSFRSRTTRAYTGP